MLRKGYIFVEKIVIQFWRFDINEICAHSVGFPLKKGYKNKLNGNFDISF